jgi:hypothetical protein
MQQLMIYLPPPTNWQDLQELVKNIADVQYPTGQVIAYGGIGQRQNGVDVFVINQFKKNIGIQCKEAKGKLTIATVVKEADAAFKFSPKLDIFIIATTVKTDRVLQDNINILNASNAYDFDIRIDFWNDISACINRYALVLNSCYATYKNELQKSDSSKHLACLRIAFDRLAFTEDFTYERSYENFESALIDTIRLFRTGFGIDRWTQMTVIHTIPIIFLPDGEYKNSVSNIESELDWLYDAYMKDKNKLLNDNLYAQKRAAQYNKMRGKILSLVNLELGNAKLKPITARYV